MRVFAALACAAAIALYIFRGLPIKHQRELAATRTPAQQVRITAYVMSIFLAAVVIMIFNFTGNTSNGVLLAAVAFCWGPHAFAPLIANASVNAHRRKRDRAVLSFLLRLQLYLGAGKTLSEATADAAAREQDEAFRRTKAQIRLEMEQSGNPLEAVAREMQGTKIGSSVATIATADALGKASSQDIVEMMERVADDLNATILETTSRLGRAVGSLAVVITTLVGLYIFIGVFSTINVS